MNPQQIGKYRIDGILGTGAMGVVYRAYDAQLGRAVAIKTIRKELLESDQPWDMLARFRNEARAAGRLSHPNIVTVYEFDEDEAAAYLVIEYVAGTGLDHWLAQRGRVDADSALRWMGQLLSALDYAHGLGVVHRDIKPANLLVTADGQIKLTDFGVARIDSSMLTQAGWLVGTPAYMSPEQLSGEPVDGRADVFSAGVLLYQLLTGCKPFSGSPSGISRQIADFARARETQSGSELPAAFDAVLLRALARDPAARYATAGEFLLALRAARPATEMNSTLGAARQDNDATQLLRPVAAGIAHAPEQAAQSTPVAPSSGWSSDTLQWLEASLAAHVGPIARVLVRKAASATGNLHELASQLALGIPSNSGRTRFLDTLNERAGQLHGADGNCPGSIHSAAKLVGPPRGIEVSPPAPAPDASALREIEQRLATHIGPMAKVALRHATRQPKALRELCLTLADSVPDARARARFLRDLGID